MRNALIFAPILVIGMALGCSDPDAPTGPARDAVRTPEFNFSNNPDAGPIIIRTEVVFAIFHVDLNKGISAIHGGDIVEFCQGNLVFDLSQLQRHFPPGDATRYMDLLHGGDLTTSVWPFTNFDCVAFTSTEPLATGTVDLVNTDNDLLVFLDPDNINANAFGWNAHGPLTDSNGDKKQYSAHSRCVWDGNDVDTLKCTDKINLQK